MIFNVGGLEIWNRFCNSEPFISTVFDLVDLVNGDIETGWGGMGDKGRPNKLLQYIWSTR